MGNTVEQIKERLSVVDVVSGYVKLERAGTNLKGRCPFHAEKTPSFFVSPARGTYHCFGCNTGGDIFTFIQEVEGLDFKGALTLLADRAGIPVVHERRETKDKRERLYTLISSSVGFFKDRLQKDSEVYAYLRHRGLTEQTIELFSIGWAPDEWRALTNYLREQGYSDAEIEQAGFGKKGEKGMYDRFRSRIIFPISDSAGRVVACSGRVFGKDADSADVPKYINSPETELFHKSKILYGYDRAKQSIRKHNCAVLVEGQMDLVASHQAGWSNTVAVSGTALTPDHVALLMRHSPNLILALDADEAGLAAARRSAAIALASGMDVKVARLPAGMDPSDVIQQQGADAWRRIIRESKHVVTFLLDVLEASARDERSFRKSVEQTVLPFVARIKSSIDREHFMREIASRINLSEQSVGDALASAIVTDDTPAAVSSAPQSPEHAGHQSPSYIRVHPRVQQAFALWLWQSALPENTSFDRSAFRKRLEEAAGEDIIRDLEDLPANEQEGLRFGAEMLYAGVEKLEEEARELIGVIERERLQADLTRATAALRKAERAGDERAVSAALKECQLLTAALARHAQTG